MKLKEREAVEEIAKKLELTANSVNKYIAAHPVCSNSRTKLLLARLHKVT